MIIYLCGGMHNNWQDKFIAHFPDGRHEFLDPRTQGKKTEQEYTKWDLEGIRSCDLIVAYMDNDNPSGFGLNLEIGFAHALGKPIYLVMEYLGFRDKYFGMARCCSQQFRSLSHVAEAIP